VLIVALAGCLGAPAPQPVAPAGTEQVFAPFSPMVPDFDFASVVDPDHAAHALPDLHTAGHGLDVVGHVAIQPSLPPGVRGSITSIDIWDHYAVVSGMEGGLGFAVVDIADPAAPEVVSWWPTAADGWTARFNEDGTMIFYGCQILGPLTIQGGGTLVGDCTDPHSLHPSTAPMGIVAVDVSDKAQPKFVDFLPTSASHNLQTARIGGVDYVFTNGVNVLAFDRAAGKLIEVTKLPGRHDATVQRSPITGDWLLFTGTDELAIYNVNDPAKPEVVFEGGIEGAVGWHEQTPIPGLIQGRWLLALAGESFSSTSGVPDKVSIADITDPANPQLLGQWQPPFQSQLPWVSYWFSAHEIAATPTGQIAVGWYHGGVWVIDVSTPERMAAPATLAAFQPHDLLNVLPSTFEQTAIPVVPFVWGAGWDARGYLVVPDMHTGVYVLEPEWGLHPALDSGQ
jgi:hypothetical protein